MGATEALVFDAIRTPRGKGKSNGSLHATKPVDLVVGLMHEMLSRNAELDPARVEGWLAAELPPAPTNPAYYASYLADDVALGRSGGLAAYVRWVGGPSSGPSSASSRSSRRYHGSMPVRARISSAATPRRNSSRIAS